MTVKALDTYVRVALTLDKKEIEGYVLNEADGTYALAKLSYASFPCTRYWYAEAE